MHLTDMGDHELEVFKILVDIFAKILTKSEVERLKKELRGYVSKENLAQVKTGKPLMTLLIRCGFLRENKLMFFKKILRNANLVEAEDMLEEYIARKKAGTAQSIDDKGFIDKKTQQRIDALEVSIERGQVSIIYKQEILEYENEETELKRLAISNLHEKIKFEDENLENITKRRMNQEDEMQKIKDYYEKVSNSISQNDRKKSKLIEEISTKENEIKELEKTSRNNEFGFDFHKDAIEKAHQAIERLRKEILIIAKERERIEYKLSNIDQLKEKQSDVIRLTNIAKKEKLNEIVNLERKLIMAKEELREHLKMVYKIELEIIKLQGNVKENELERERTSKQGLHCQSDYLIRAYKKIKKRFEAMNFQVLDYGNLDEFDSYIFGETGSRLSPLQFKSPINVAFDKNGRLLILDKGNKRIVSSDVVGNDPHLLIDLGSSFQAVDMTVNHKGQLLLISSSLIKVFNETGEILFQFLPNLESREELPRLSGIAVNVNDEIFVCDAANKKIQLFTEMGEFLRCIRLDDSFFGPKKLAVIGEYELIVSDDVDSNLKTMRVSRDQLTRPKVIGGEGVCFCEFIRPLSLALDSDNNVLIVDSGNNRIQVLDTQKDVIAEFGRLGSRPGCLDRPSGVAVHPYGLIAVADTYNDRIVIFN